MCKGTKKFSEIQINHDFYFLQQTISRYSQSLFHRQKRQQQKLISVILNKIFAKYLSFSFFIIIFATFYRKSNNVQHK